MKTSFLKIGIAGILIALFITSCAPLKVAQLSTGMEAVKGAKKKVGNYEFLIEKKRDAPVEIIEVALLHNTTKARLNLSFSLLNPTTKAKLLTLAGEETFLISGKAAGESDLSPYDTALVVYRIGEDGKSKVLRVKNIEAPK